MNAEHRLSELVDEVTRRRMQPEDRYEVAALLESIGWNDSRVRETFGVRDVFELADVVWEQMQGRVLFTPFAEPKANGFFTIVIGLVRQFLRGVIFALPMAVSVVSMLTLRFSLWSYENLSTDLATAIAIGTIVSFVTVGGFTQAIARRGFFYIMQGYFNMGRRITFQFIGIGFIVCIAVCVLILLFNLVFSLFPYRMLGVTVLYFFFLNSIWLSVTVMYILRKEIVFTGLIILGIGIVYVMFELFHVNIIFSQLIALSLVSAVSLGLVVYFFKQAESRMEKGISPQMPRMSITMYSTMPYFLYGVLYFAFLFVDRVVAWSTNDKNYMPYLIWFRGGYELGLDFSLLMLIVPMGISEVVVSKLMTDLERSQKGYMAYESERMNRKYVRMYVRRLLTIGAASAASGIATYAATQWIFGHLPVSGIGRSLFEGGDTHFVYIRALLAYVIVSAALMNAVILFSLSQPKLVTRSLWPAFVANVAIGFVLSRWFGHTYAVYGLLAGTVIFLVLSCRQVLKVMNNLDYYLYASS